MEIGSLFHFYKRGQFEPGQYLSCFAMFFRDVRFETHRLIDNRSHFGLPCSIEGRFLIL